MDGCSTIDSIVRVSTQGMSRPYVCRDRQGDLFWCKGNHTGLKAVMSEWVCASIAQAVGLPVPAFSIARMDFKCFETWRAHEKGKCPSIVTATNPYVFASKDVADAKDVINAEQDLRNDDPTVLGKIYLFDEFIRNVDRTDSNSNLLTNHSVHVIDHNNAFDVSFDRVVFAQKHALRTFFSRMPAPEVSAFRQMLRDTVTDAFLDSVWSAMPSEWTDVGEVVFSLDMIRMMLNEDKENA